MICVEIKSSPQQKPQEYKRKAIAYRRRHPQHRIGKRNWEILQNQEWFLKKNKIKLEKHVPLWQYRQRDEGTKYKIIQFINGDVIQTDKGEILLRREHCHTSVTFIRGTNAKGKFKASLEGGLAKTQDSNPTCERHRAEVIRLPTEVKHIKPGRRPRAV